MANEQTHVKGRTGKSEIAITHNKTDSPILPVAQLKELQEIAPHRIDWVFEQTEAEATFRRQFDARMLTQVFIERILALLVAAATCGGSIYAAFLLTQSGHDWVATAFVSTGIAGIVIAFLRYRRS